jgi:hypothetical protein
MNKSILLIILALLSMKVGADTKTDKIKKIMEIQGQVQMWQEAIDSGKKQSEKLGTTAMDQLISRLSPSAEFKKKFNDAFNAFLSKVQAPWSAAEIVDKWASFYGPQFTEAELDQLIAFYSSDLGLKDISATRRAMTQFQEYYQNAGAPIFEKATKEYIEELQLVARQCKCEKKTKGRRAE